jgi:hypothetical protein
MNQLLNEVYHQVFVARPRTLKNFLPDMPLLFRNIRSGKRKALITDLDNIAKKAINEALDKDVKPALIKSHNLVVANWKHKPKFQTRKDIRPNKITMSVFPVGDNAEIYTFVDQGTRPHVIKAKNAPRLVFQTGYKPKTLARPARTVSGGGVATGPTVFAKQVQHPGSEAREFSETIAEDIKPDFKRTIENTFKQVSKQLEE